MFNSATNTLLEQERPNLAKERLEDILRTIDSLIFSIKMDSFQSISTQRSGNGNRVMENSVQEMMAKKNILFNLLPKDELFALTKKKTAAPRPAPMN